MLEKILGMSVNTTLTDLGALAALTSIIVQVLKKIVPSKFPTQALVIIVALFITTLASVMYYGVILSAFGIGILSGFVVAFIAMEGFDSLKNIWQRFTVKPELLTEDLEEEKEVITSDGAEVFGDELEYDNWDDAVFENGGEG